MSRGSVNGTSGRGSAQGYQLPPTPPSGGRANRGRRSSAGGRYFVHLFSFGEIFSTSVCHNSKIYQRLRTLTHVCCAIRQGQQKGKRTIIGLALKDARFQWKRRENNTPVASTETQAREKNSIGGNWYFLVLFSLVDYWFDHTRLRDGLCNLGLLDLA